jgi:phosphoribosylaminoimidazole-succinocarboxamide synthase
LFRRRYLSSGKVKDIFEVDDHLLFVFTDRLSSHDVVLADTIPYKGEVLCRISAHCFKRCTEKGIENHMIRTTAPNEMLVKRLSIIPIEVIGRNYLYGSYWKRFKRGEVTLPKGSRPILAAPLSELVIEFTTKFEVKDRPIEVEEILSRNWLKAEELNQILEETKRLNELISEDASRAGLLLADFKLEFGRDEEGSIFLADEAETPDSCRYWDAKTYEEGKAQDSFDKQIVRDYLERVLGWDVKQPEPGTRLKETILPEDIVKKTSQRYIEVLERLTGERFRGT